MARQQKTIQQSEAIKAKPDLEWLDSDISRLGEHEPYDWGGVDPLTLGKPVRYLAGVGFVVDGDKTSD